jgi:hypothetical protein
MPPALNPEKREHARELRRAGASLAQIMRDLGISYGSAQRFTKGVRPDLERDPEHVEKITAAKAGPHTEWVGTVPRSECDTAGCSEPSCGIDFGLCHCGCGEAAAIADQDDRKRNYVKGEPRLYATGHKGTLMVAGEGVPLEEAIKRVNLTASQVALDAGLSDGRLSDLIRLHGDRLRRRHCEEVVRVLREEHDRRGLDACELTLAQLFTTDSPADEAPGRRPAHRKKRRRPPLPPDKRGDGRHFRADAERARRTVEADGLWIQEKACAKLLLPRPTFIRMEDRGRITSERRKVGTVVVRAYVPRDVKQLGVELRTSDALWDRRRRDRDFVLGWALTHGASAKEALRRADHVADQLEVWRRIRIGTGRPKADGPPAFHWDWAHRFLELKAELDAQHEWFHLEGERPPSNHGVALLLAEDDVDGHAPGLWDYDPREFPAEASRRVWKAVKSLLNQGTETPLA